jgi:DNA-binding Xre family transcriptional regulator
MREENIANTTKQTKNIIVRRAIIESLERNATLKGGRRLDINEIVRGRDSLSPAMRRKRGGNYHRTSSLKKMMVLTLSNVILGMRIRSRELRKSTVLSKNTTQMLGDILTNRISTTHTNICRELSENHGCKTLINGKHLTTRRHEIQPSVTRKIIYKDDIISMGLFRSKRSRSRNIRVN